MKQRMKMPYKYENTESDDIAKIESLALRLTEAMNRNVFGCILFCLFEIRTSDKIWCCLSSISESFSFLSTLVKLPITKVYYGKGNKISLIASTKCHTNMTSNSATKRQECLAWNWNLAWVIIHSYLMQTTARSFSARPPFARCSWITISGAS